MQNGINAVTFPEALKGGDVEVLVRSSAVRACTLLDSLFLQNLNSGSTGEGPVQQQPDGATADAERRLERS